jgi:hypothetical protein
MGAVPPHWAVYFAVDDTDRAVGLVEAGGGAVLVPATDSPFGRWTLVSDPAGASFYVITLPDPD